MISKIDLSILNFIQNKIKCKFLDKTMPKISMLGNLGIVWIICSILMLADTRYEDSGEEIVSGLIIGVLIGNLLIKHIFSRPRPFLVEKHPQLLIKEPRDFSFPSGHTLSSVIATCVLLHTNTTFGMIALVLCILIMFSRIYLFVHYPSDILGGIALGILIGISIINIS